MKKRIAVVLCLVMVSMSLAGCSPAETDYLNMSKQMASESYKVTGTLTGEIDFDALKTLVKKTETSIKTPEGGSGAITTATDATDELFADAPKGKQAVKVTYDALVNMKDNVAMQVDFDMQVNGKTYEMGDLYMDAAKGFYLSKDTVLGFYDMYTDLVPNTYASYFYTKEYRDGLSAAFAGNDYVYAGYLTGLSAEEQAEVSDMMNGTFSKEIYDAAFNFIETAFSGFTTGTVSKVNGGYQISLNGEQSKKLIADMLQYFIDNIDTVMTAYSDYMKVIVSNMNLSDAERAEMNASFETLFAKENRVMATAGLAAAKQAFIQADQEGYLDILDGFQYKAVIKKAGTGYAQSEDMSLKDGSKNVISLKSNAEVVMQDVTISMPQKGISFEDFDKSMNTLENKYNPVTSATIEWWNDDTEDDLAFLTYARNGSSPLASADKYDSEPYFITNGSSYLPLRSISEAFGETVTWDQAAKKAYVVRDGKQIAVTGVLKDGKTYIKVRDFEKLGYTVEYSYEKESTIHTVKIAK